MVMFVGMSLLLMSQAVARGAEIIGPPDPVAQGEVVQILVKGVRDGDRVKGVWREQPLEFFKLGAEDYGSLLGIDLRLSPGTYPLKVEVDSPVNSLQTSRTNIKVVKKDFGVQRLTLPENLVTLDPATLKRVRKEAAKFSELWYKHTPKRYWHGNFVRPVPGKLTTSFGLGRILNGERRSPHSGVDLRAPMGEPVRAANHGRVVLVGSFYFHGNAVVLDHGWGLYTMYFHLSEVNVSEDDLVGKNFVIGLAGSTGRSTGSHLHWGVRLGGARVDPFALLRATTE
ncbi:MAG: M23 family metallopeptidase [Syntrophobacterales bacterium]|jgi:murein DD-endopeptidase MepM/ murein hydrolase activator NlpD